MQYINSASGIFQNALQDNCFGFVDKTVGSIYVSTFSYKNITCVDSWVSFIFLLSRCHGYQIINSSGSGSSSDSIRLP